MRGKAGVVFLSLGAGVLGAVVCAALAFAPMFLIEAFRSTDNINYWNPLGWFLSNSVAGWCIAGVLTFLIGWYTRAPVATGVAGWLLAALFAIGFPAPSILSGAYADDLMQVYLLGILVVNVGGALLVGLSRPRAGNVS